MKIGIPDALKSEVRERWAIVEREQELARQHLVTAHLVKEGLGALIERELHIPILSDSSYQLDVDAMAIEKQDGHAEEQKRPRKGPRKARRTLE